MSLRLAPALVLLLAVSSLGAQEVAAPVAADPPRIGLALSGGGARGGAHAGVLKVLEELHVPVHAISGTSMGAVVGGLYAAGLPVERIDEVLRTTDWNDALEDRPAFRDLIWRRKEESARFLLDFELGFRGGKLRLPGGLRAGQKLAFVLRSLLLEGASDDFSGLTIPTKIAATDVETGELVVLDRGDLAEAIVASTSIPGVFAPVEIDGRLLVDGGVADNLPVDLARAMGADVVIAIDVGTPFAERDRLDSIFSVLGQTTNFLTRKNTLASLAQADLVVTPELEGIGSASFERIGEAIARGEAAARAVAGDLRRYALDDASWEAHRGARARAAKPPPARTISEIRVEGTRLVDARVVLERVHMRTGQVLDLPELREDLARVFGLDDFQRVNVRLERADYGDVLVLRVKEKPWGPTYIKFGLEAVDDLEGSATYAVRASAARTRLNARGGEWRTEVQIGSSPGTYTELYQPLDFRGRFFFAPWASTQRSQQRLFEDGRSIAAYDIRTVGGGIDFGVQFGRYGAMRAGVVRGRTKAEVTTGSADLPSFEVDSGAFRFLLAISTLDRPAIPRTGGTVGVRGYFPRRSLGSDEPYDRLEAFASRFFGRGRHTGFVVGEGGTNLGSRIPIYDEFALGGLFSLGGFSEGEFRGQLFGKFMAGYHFRLASLPAGFGQGIYLGAMAEIGNVWPTRQAVSLRDTRHGFTAIVGLDSVVGPVFLAYGVGEGGSDRYYLAVGRSF